MPRIRSESRSWPTSSVSSFLTVRSQSFSAAGVGSTAPYGHRGDLGTLAEAIAHHGGEAAAVRDAFDALPEADRAAIIEFLKSLRIEEQSAGVGQ